MATLDQNKKQELIATEAKRRETFVGDLTVADFGTKKFRVHARHTRLPRRFLRRLILDKENGTTEWQRDWLDAEISEEDFRKAKELHEIIAQWSDKIEITVDDFKAAANHLGVTLKVDKSVRTVERILYRYRVGGLLGLVKGHNPETSRHRNKGISLALEDLTDVQMTELLKRYELIKPCLGRGKATAKRVAELAKQSGYSEASLWAWIGKARKGGLKALVKSLRSDKGTSQVDPPIQDWIRGMKFKHPFMRDKGVWRSVQRLCLQLGKDFPSYAQVRVVIAHIPEIDKVLASGDQKTYNSKFRLAGKFPESDDVIWELDASPANMMVFDPEDKSKGIRPEQLKLVDRKTGAWLLCEFSLMALDEHDVAAFIGRALVKYGRPERIIVDMGKVMVSQLVKQLLSALDVLLDELEGHYPQGKPHVERSFRIDDDQFYREQEGYTGPNVAERPPNVHPKMSLAELESKYRKYQDDHNNEIFDAVTGESRIGFFKTHCVTRHIENERDLDILLMPKEKRTVQPVGIHFRNRLYWAEEIHGLVGNDIWVRSPSAYTAPDEILVFSFDESVQYLFTALADDTPEGNEARRRGLKNARQLQKGESRERRRAARRVLRDAERKAAKKRPRKSEEAKTQASPPDVTPKDKGADPRHYEERKKSKKRPENPWDELPDSL